MANIIYPVNQNKYGGFITKRKRDIMSDLTTSKSITPSPHLQRHRQSREVAIAHNKVKNIIHDCGEYVEVELTQNKRCKIDSEDVFIVDNYVVCVADIGGGTYAIAYDSETKQRATSLCSI